MRQGLFVHLSLFWCAVWVGRERVLAEHGRQVVTVEAIGCAREVLSRVVVLGRGVEQAADRVVEHVVRKVAALVAPERGCAARQGGLV